MSVPDRDPALASGTKKKQPFNEAAQEIQRALNADSKRPMNVTPFAREQLETFHAAFLGRLGSEAVNLARSSGLHSVDDVHVQKAAARLGREPLASGLGNAFLAFGGLFAGSGFSMAISLLVDESEPSVTRIVVALALSVLGTAFLATGTTLMIANRG